MQRAPRPELRHVADTTARRSPLNAVENFFSVLTRRAIRRSVFKSVADLQDAIRAYIRRQQRSHAFRLDETRGNNPRKAQAVA
jgi:hypothetical protein